MPAPKPPLPDPPARPLRADAARNRVLILQAAREVFREGGLDMTLDDIAAHAGVGVGTVYRRFPDRESLVEALFDQQMQDTVQLARKALSGGDPWTGLISVMHSICHDIATDRGLRQVMLSSRYGLDRVASSRTLMVPLLERLVEGARHSGELRPDFQAADIPILFLMVSSVADFSSEVRPQLWERSFRFFSDGMRAHPAPGRPDVPPLPGALSPDQTAAAMASWKPSRR